VKEKLIMTLKGAFAAAIGGAVGALSSAAIDPEHATDLKKLGSMALVGAGIAVSHYFFPAPQQKKSE
jgi:hypothetical protein